jgi:heat induced stress protein YflT
LSGASILKRKLRDSRTKRRFFDKESKMASIDSVVALFSDHEAAEAAVKKLAAAGFEMKNLSVVGKGYHTDEKVVGFYNIGDRVKFWGTRGAFWGGFWGLFFGGLFVTVPLVGHVVVLGYLATILVAAIENAVAVGGLSALGAAIYSMGVPKDSVIAYEAAVKADDFLVMAHGTAEEMARAKAILGTTNASRVDAHNSATEQSGHLAVAG